MSQQTAVSRRKIAGERARRAPVAAPTPPAIASPSRVRRRATGLFQGRLVPGWLLLGLAVLTAAVLVFDGVTWARSGAPTDGGSPAIGPDALNAAPAQAEKAAEQMLSYDYADLKADTAATAAYLTPAYAQTFRRTVDDLLASSAAERRGVVTATVMASGVVAADAGKVDVLLFVDQTSTTAGVKSPQTALNRVVLTMVYSDRRWLVDDVTAL